MGHRVSGDGRTPPADGDDGAAGLHALKEAGARTIVESEETAVIFGMPRAAAPAADRVLRLEEIGRTITSLCGTGAARGDL